MTDRVTTLGSARVGKTYTCVMEVRWADFDRLGHVNNVKYFEYAQEARIKFIASCLGEMFGRDETRSVVRKYDMEYLRPYDDLTEPLHIDVDVVHIGRTSYTIRHTMRNAADVVFAVATAVLVNFDPKTGKALALTDDVRTAFSDYLVEQRTD